MKTRQEILAEDYAQQMQKKDTEQMHIVCRHDDNTEWSVTELPDGTFATQSTRVQDIEDKVNSLPDDLFVSEEEAAKRQRGDIILAFRRTDALEIAKANAKWKAEHEAQEAEKQAGQKLREAQAKAAENEEIIGFLKIAGILLAIGLIGSMFLGTAAPESLFSPSSKFTLLDDITDIGKIFACLALIIVTGKTLWPVIKKIIAILKRRMNKTELNQIIEEVTAPHTYGPCICHRKDSKGDGRKG